jgi:hypothetical protein
MKPDSLVWKALPIFFDASVELKPDQISERDGYLIQQLDTFIDVYNDKGKRIIRTGPNGAFLDEELPRRLHAWEMWEIRDGELYTRDQEGKEGKVRSDTFGFRTSVWGSIGRGRVHMAGYMYFEEAEYKYKGQQRVKLPHDGLEFWTSHKAKGVTYLFWNSVGADPDRRFMTYTGVWRSVDLSWSGTKGVQGEAIYSQDAPATLASEASHKFTRIAWHAGPPVSFLFTPHVKLQSEEVKW